MACFPGLIVSARLCQQFAALGTRPALAIRRFNARYPQDTIQDGRLWIMMGARIRVMGIVGARMVIDTSALAKVHRVMHRMSP
ncbi:MAG: hypothetical protein JWL66_1500 [Sphingomonadales bacterium]|nr:hypothetical protein [Sphingomonadales bacterium]